jgi:cytochrome c-type biogenesis protein
MENVQPRDGKLFLNSVFFVLGFSTVFALLGVLLQTVLSAAGYTVQAWLGRIGGVIIILFGLYLVGLIRPSFLEREHRVTLKKRFSSAYLTSFVFGAAFAVGWTPCVSAALGAILGLAATQPSSAFFLLMAYTLGLGIPFLVAGAFASRAQALINRAGKVLVYLNYAFGAFLVVLGVLVFTSQLNRIANFSVVASIFPMGGLSVGSSIAGLSIASLGISALAGLVSFLSPCVLPLVPAFLAYLASLSVKEGA